MDSRHEKSHNAQPRRYGLVPAGAVIGIAIGLAVAAAMLPPSRALVAAGASAVHAAATAAEPQLPAAAATPALEYPGAMGRYSDQPIEQPPTF